MHSHIHAAPWPAAGLRRAARSLEDMADRLDDFSAFAADRVENLFAATADRLEHLFGKDPAVVSTEPYFDSDAYLAEVRDRVLKHYY